MDEENQQSESLTHVLVFPFPLQGHINPMLQFAKRLASKGLRVTMISASNQPLRARGASSIRVEHISSGFNENEEKPSIDEHLKRFQENVLKTLSKFLDEQRRSSHPPKALVYDSVMPWALDVAQDSGLYAAAFFTQAWAVNAIYYHIHLGNSCSVAPVEERDQSVLHSFPSLPLLGTKDLPSFLCDSGLYVGLFALVVSQFSNCKRADWLLCNTFDKLEDKVMKWMKTQLPVKNIGPTLPSMFLDKRLREDNDYGLSLFEPNTNACKEWLDSKQPNSVVYISFGSLAALGEDQMKELAWGLKLCGSFFLWVVRASEMNKLPSNYAEEISEKGLVVNWSPQLEVLAHEATGCFVTHCGWNSTLEALSLGVPMVGVPQWTDQPTNAKFVSDVWKVGIRVKVNEKGFIMKEEIARCIGEIMEGEKGREIKSNSAKWKELAKEAVSEGGSSDQSINDLAAKLANH